MWKAIVIIAGSIIPAAPAQSPPNDLVDPRSIDTHEYAIIMAALPIVAFVGAASAISWFLRPRWVQRSDRPLMKAWKRWLIVLPSCIAIWMMLLIGFEFASIGLGWPRYRTMPASLALMFGCYLWYWLGRGNWRSRSKRQYRDYIVQ